MLKKLAIAGFACLGLGLAGWFAVSQGWFFSPEPVKFPPRPAQDIFHCEYDIDTDGMDICRAEVRSGQDFSTLLGSYGVSAEQSAALASQQPDVFDPRKMKAGQPYTVLVEKGSGKARYFIYEADAVNYVVFHLDGMGKLTSGAKPVVTRVKSTGGVISGSLWESLENAGIDPNIAIPLAEMYAWSIDFYHIQRGDAFKVIVEEQEVEGRRINSGKVTAAWFRHKGKEYYGIPFERNGKLEYFNKNGESLRQAFLKAPLKYSRISSRYNLKRYHPILKRTKAHLGTDYAAPTGTPIYSVGDGTVLEAQRKGGNGIYVKIKHNQTYTTQYLHMSRIEKGIKPGVRVQQGQVIGYVGQTGLATGPHLCYRFWKNGEQVDPLKEEGPHAEPISKEEHAAFDKISQDISSRLDAIDLHETKDASGGK